MQDRDPKLYVLVRDDLSPGLQLAQAVHAATAFAQRYPERSRSTENAVILAVPDETTLLIYADLDKFSPDPGVTFREPDLDDEATAHANVCSGYAYRRLPLAGQVSMLA